MKNFILCFFMLLASSGILRAEDVTFETTVSPARVSLDEVMQLSLTVTGVNDNLDPVSLPVIDGFTAKYLGPSTNVSIINGDYHSERSFVYNLFPNKVGHFQIPAITATIAGHSYTTKPIDVEVLQSSSQSQASAQTSNQNQAPTPESLKDKLILVARTKKTNVYLNEKVPLTIKLLINEVPMRDIQYPQFDKEGFSVDDFEKPEQSAQMIDGVKYDLIEFKTNIYPNHLGDITIGPMQIQGNVLYKTGQSNPFNQDSGFLGTDVFNNFFDSYATSPVTVSSDPIRIHVLPLPEDNRPSDFSGAIGKFDFEATVSPAQVKAGDPLTLKMDIKGSGDFKNLKMPIFKADGFKTYEPTIKNLGDEKTAEEVIIPTSLGIKEVPALSFSYFDTGIKDYRTVTQGPFPIQVVAPSADQEFKAVGFADISKETSMASAHQFYLGKILYRLFKFIKKLCRSMWFWISLGVVSIMVIAYFLWRRFQERLAHDPAFARKLKAVREARQGLKQAEECISKVKTKDFYALLSKVLREYLANKWHQSQAALSIDGIVKHLKIVKLDEATIGRVKTILEQSDLVCFAGATADPDKMRSDLSQVRELIAQLEKQLK